MIIIDGNWAIYNMTSRIKSSLDIIIQEIEFIKKELDLRPEWVKPKPNLVLYSFDGIKLKDSPKPDLKLFKISEAVTNK